jgi:phage tail sheath protein FI
MPEYLAPGVYVEEVSYRSKSIEGVSTTTTGFIGPTRYGPVGEVPQLVTSLIEFERMYGDRQQLGFGDAGTMHNYMWHAVRAFFEQGGRRAYIKRVFNGDLETAAADSDLGGGAAAGTGITIRARFPGAAGGRRVRISVARGPSILGWTGPVDGRRRSVGGLSEGDVVWLFEGGSPPGAGDLYIARSSTTAAGLRTWSFVDPDDSPPGSGVSLDDLTDAAAEVRVVTVSVTDIPSDPTSISTVWSGLAVEPTHTTGGAADSLFDVFGEYPANQTQALTLPFVIERGANVVSGLDALNVIFAAAPAGEDPRAALDTDTAEAQRSYEIALDPGSDGDRPTAGEYEGDEIDTPHGPLKTGLVSFEDIDDISIVAAPGSTYGFEESEANRDQAATVQSLLISHCERMRYRIAVLDSGDRQGISAVRAMRATIDSSHAAFYYPWVKVMDPVTQAEIELPPSGFVAGIYARNDVNRAVYKAPANEVVNLAIGFETLLSKGQQDVLNPEGINCFRYFEGRGLRLWGARTASSDPEWKYVNLRRYFAYLEHSVDRGTQWAVFEPNGEALWGNVRRTIEDFLFNEWQMGALLGDKPEKAYFVKCDRTTMTQNDLDNGRLVCMVGVAALRPAEYVIFRIGQWTSDARR